MELEYKIIYKIDGDIPINPSWIGEQLDLGVQALQKKINKKNLHGAHKLELKHPEGWAPPGIPGVHKLRKKLTSSQA